MVNIPEDILKLNNRIENENKFTHKIANKYIEEVYDLKSKYLDDNQSYEILEHIEKYLKHQNQKLDSYKNTIISIISTIFIPFGVITGYFGMNFASMGNPGIKQGILSSKNSEKYLFIMFVTIALFIVFVHHVWFDLS